MRHATKACERRAPRLVRGSGPSLLACVRGGSFCPVYVPHVWSQRGAWHSRGNVEQSTGARERPSCSPSAHVWPRVDCGLWTVCLCACVGCGFDLCVGSPGRPHVTRRRGASAAARPLSQMIEIVFVCAALGRCMLERRVGNMLQRYDYTLWGYFTVSYNPFFSQHQQRRLYRIVLQYRSTRTADRSSVFTVVDVHPTPTRHGMVQVHVRI